MIFALPGAVFPLWDQHFTSDHRIAGVYLLSLNAGFQLGIQIGRGLQRQFGVHRTALGGAMAAAVAWVAVLLTAPPVTSVGRDLALLSLGGAGGITMAMSFQLIQPFYERAPAVTLNLGGILFGAGCLLTSLLMALGIEIAPWLPPALCGIIAMSLAIWYWRPFGIATTSGGESLQQPATVRDFRDTFAILLALLMFFQFTAEWSVAAWLALNLIQRLGISPRSALQLLSLYWAALVVGRIAAQWALPKLAHGRLLIGGVFAATLGCTILSVTDSVTGAAVAVLLLGFGFSIVYPLVSEKAKARVPYFHPVYFRGVFLIAVTLGLLTPAANGWITAKLGIGWAFLLPLAGSIAVLLLSLLIWMDAKFNPVD